MNICQWCDSEFPPDKFHPHQKFCCRQCKYAEYNHRRRTVLDTNRRKEAVQILGGKCILCGTTDKYFLCLDHINDDAKKDKERWTADRVRNLWIIDNLDEARQIFQVLCYNCNNLKRNNREEYDKRLTIKFK